ncbi:MAG TPA: PA14 domain-containing protein, partial [Candidatus Hydrogenedentes bacterium]|nr:PA14 domain-containing protein [Candidatus Hydrogenedentota bacterium]
MQGRLLGIVIAICLAGTTVAEEELPGLVGPYYGNADLTVLNGGAILESLNVAWDANTGRGMEWSGWWEGCVRGPVTGTVHFGIESAKSALIEIDGVKVGEVRNGRVLSGGDVSMVKDRRYPVRVTYWHTGGTASFLRATWSWEGTAAHAVPAAFLTHTAAQEEEHEYVPLTSTREQIAALDRSRFATVDARHFTVFREPGRFAGWPANRGIWQWGDEILVAFSVGEYKEFLE